MITSDLLAFPGNWKGLNYTDEPVRRQCEHHPDRGRTGVVEGDARRPVAPRRRALAFLSLPIAPLRELPQLA